MDFIILISYIYAAIPCLLAVISYNLVCNNKEQLCYKFEGLDEDGYPHWSNNEELPHLNPGQQQFLIKQAICSYFAEIY
jgi:hypothetical protein